MRKIRVMVNNDRERDAVLKEFEREGVKWNDGHTATDYKPKRKYPYYIYRGGCLTHGAVRVDSCFSGFKEVPASTFIELDKDAEIEEIRVKVHNNRERDAVLRQFEREGLKWAGLWKKPTEWQPKQTYPYYLLRRRDIFGGGMVTYSKCIHDTFIREVSVRVFLDLAELDKDVITITSDGKTVTAEMGGRKGVAKCSPDDEFSLETGAKLALDRLFELKAGDFVRVKDNSFAKEWAWKFMVDNCNKEMCAKFVYNGIPHTEEVVKVISAYPYLDRQMTICERIGNVGELFVIDAKGLEKID